MSTSDPDLRKVFASLADSFAMTDVIGVFNGLVDACIANTSATEGGIVLADKEGVLHVMASSSERSADVEEAQLGTREGPCIDCVQSGEQLEVADLADYTETWPEFSKLARTRGFAAVHATPMRLRGLTLGSLCLFADQPGPLSDRDAALVQTLADAATLSILQQHVLDESQALAEQLQHALDSRVVIEQAKGALSQRLGISIDEAFHLLRRQARSTGRLIRDVASEIVQPTAQ